MTILRFLGIAVACGAFILSAAPSALATSVYPANDLVTLGSAPVELTFNGSYYETCTLNGGSFKLEYENKGITHNIGGPIVMNFITIPTLTSCSGGWAVTTSGAWKLTAEYGKSTPVLTIPAGGISTFGMSNSAATVGSPGAWFNGFSSPVSVATAVDPGAVTAKLGSGGAEFTIPQALLSATDTTHPGSLPLVGP